MDTWAFDPNSGQCTNFHFMCKGQALTNNMNRFDSHGVCQNYCGTQEGRSLAVSSTKQIPGRAHNSGGSKISKKIAIYGGEIKILFFKKY